MNVRRPARTPALPGLSTFKASHRVPAMNTRSRLPLWILLGIAVLLLILHLALPHLVLNYLNDKMADMGDYRGQVEDVDLAWWRGAYRVEGVLIEKKDKEVPAPLFSAPAIDIAVSWGALWHKREVVGEVEFQEPKLNFVDGAGKTESQTGEGVDWRQKLEEMIPITLNEVRVVDGQVAFRNFNADPPVNVYASDVDASIYNLTTAAEESSDGRVANLDGTAKLFNQAPLEARATFDPLSDWENFELELRVTGVQLTRLNEFSLAYGKFDFEAGSGDLVMEVEATDSQLSGYIKPLLRDVQVFDFEQDVANKEKGFFQGIWEAVVGAGEDILKNKEKNQFATRVELSGSTKDTDVSPFQAFLAVLRNGFVEAFSARFERSLVGGDD